MKKTKVMVFGVFDLLHPGHISFLKQAKKLGDFLVVSVARDVNVKRVKGHLPVFAEFERLVSLKSLKFVNKAVLGGSTNPWPHIIKERPDVIALGYDQKPYVTYHGTRNIEQELRKRGLKTKVVRLEEYKPEVYKSKLLRKKLQ